MYILGSHINWKKWDRGPTSPVLDFHPVAVFQQFTRFGAFFQQKSPMAKSLLWVLQTFSRSFICIMTVKKHTAVMIFSFSWLGPRPTDQAGSSRRDIKKARKRDLLVSWPLCLSCALACEIRWSDLKHYNPYLMVVTLCLMTSILKVETEEFRNQLLLLPPKPFLCLLCG